MKLEIFFILFSIQACGHEQSFVEDDSFDAAAPLPAQNQTPPNAASDCRGFITSVISFDPGDRAGFGQENFPDIVLGPPRGGGERVQGLDVLTLGSLGSITVDVSPCLIVDQTGPDFIVFENAFLFGPNPEHVFAELARASVSLDGEDFTEFPCEAEAYPYTGCAGWHVVLTNPDNGISPFDAESAGGDPFDLADVGIPQARFVRLEDVWGIGPPGKAGFDLDAIAVVNGLTNY